MWLLFAAAVLISAVVLYLPGYFAGRAVRLGSFAAFAVAPAFSVVLLVALGVALQMASVPCPAWALLLAAFAIALAVYGVSRFAVKGFGAGGEVHELAANWKLIVLYVAASLVVSLLVFLHAARFDPSAFCRLDDNTVHYSVIRSFLDTGFYSALHASGYSTLGEVGGYYPAAWHIVVAVVASFVGNSVAVASNAMIIVACAVVLPVGLVYMLKRVFPGEENKAIVVAGAVVAVAFSGFPWGFVVRGQLLSNLLSFALIPGAMGLLAECVYGGKGRVLRAAAFVVCVIAVALSQPNGSFTLGIWAVAFGIGCLLCPIGQKSHTPPNRKRVVLALLLLACACIVWVVLYFAPPLHTVTSYTWKAFLSPAQAIFAGATFMFSERTGIQPFLTVLVAIGIARTLKNKQYLWLTVAFLFAFVSWFIGVTTDGLVKHLLAGFWYTDHFRTGAMASLFAIPLAAVGFAWLFEWLKNLLSKHFSEKLGAKRAGVVSLATLLAVMLCVQFFPAHVKVGDSDIRTGLMAVHKQVKTRYSWQKYYTVEESAFVKKVQAEIPEDAIVVNFPNDGSCYAYGIDGLNTFYRRSSPSAFAGPTETGRLLRTSLSSVSTSATVQKAVKDSGVQYVLLLDVPSDDATRTVSGLRYREEDWQGIESINDETPGFTKLLSEGDMRLYRIDAAFAG